MADLMIRVSRQIDVVRERYYLSRQDECGQHRSGDGAPEGACYVVLCLCRPHRQENTTWCADSSTGLRSTGNAGHPKSTGPRDSTATVT